MTRILMSISLLVLMFYLPAMAEPRLVTLSTGSSQGVYYGAGGTLCGLLNANRWQHGIRCQVRQSTGSIDNLQALRSGEVDFAIVQSDWQYHALRGTSVFESRGPFRALRSLMALYPEPFTLIARRDSGITQFSDLKAKRISLGPLGSGSRATMDVVLAELGWVETDFSHVSDVSGAELTQALCNSDLDAAVVVIGHPNLTIEDKLSACDAVLVKIDPEIVERLTAKYPYFQSYVISADTYSTQTGDVATFALTATLVTVAQTSPVVVRELTRQVVQTADLLRETHPSFADFDTQTLVSNGLSAPLHDTARLVYRQLNVISEP